MRRYVPILIAGSALIAAACRDSVAPTATASRTQPVIAFTRGSTVASAVADVAAESNAAVSTFQLNPWGGIVRLGTFVLVYPANAVCDPNRSGYGPDEWKKSCPTIWRSITISARTWTQDGVSYAEFSPDVRFNPAKVVTLNTFISEIRGMQVTDDLRAQYAIGYTLREGTTRFYVDEGAGDPEMATFFGQRNGVATGFASRRIYHFSGYYVRAGFADDGLTDPSAVGTQ
jgi:hypothetical protein